MTTIVTVGHVDHGKSTILGHLMLKMGLVPEHLWRKICEDAKELKMEPWKYAQILDIYDDEKETGKTLEHSSFSLELEDEKVIFVDTPGHLSLVKEVIQGMTNATICMIIISARTGEFESGWSGQTREHLYIARGMGISNVIIAWNKMDCIEWKKEALTEYREIIAKFLKKIGMKEVTEVFISGWTGENLVEARDARDETLKNVLLKHVEKYKNKKIENVTIPENPPLGGRPQEQCSLLHLEILFIGTGVFSAGWQGIFHAGLFESEIEIVKIKGKKFLKEGEYGEIIVKVEKQLPIDVYRHCIIRTQEFTVGMGKVIGGK